MKLTEPLVIRDRLVETVGIEHDRDGTFRVKVRQGKKRKKDGGWHASASHIYDYRDGEYTMPEEALPAILMQYAEEMRALAARHDDLASHARVVAESADAQAIALRDRVTP